MSGDTIERLAQACYSSNPVIVLGSGASMQHGLPSMGDLQRFLIDTLEPENDDEVDAWLLVKTAMYEGDHLEKAMEGKRLPVTLTSKIVNLTWKCVNNSDFQVFRRAIVESEEFPIGLLIRGLSNSSNNIINIVTTNYDRVIEYACNSQKLMYLTGFSTGYIQHREGVEPITIKQGSRQTKLVRIWKVHGSLDWFAQGDKAPFSAPFFESPPDDVRPLIVTPGLYKFEQTQYEPFRSIMSGADAAFERASGFICVGFGFRDSHIEPKLFARCRSENVPVAVIARTLTSEAKAFLRSRAGSKYIGLESCDAGSRVFTAQGPDGIEIQEPDLWSLKGFLNLVT